MKVKKYPQMFLQMFLYDDNLIQCIKKWWVWYLFVMKQKKIKEDGEHEVYVTVTIAKASLTG